MHVCVLSALPTCFSGADGRRCASDRVVENEMRKCMVFREFATIAAGKCGRHAIGEDKDTVRWSWKDGKKRGSFCPTCVFNRQMTKCYSILNGFAGAEFLRFLHSRLV